MTRTQRQLETFRKGDACLLVREAADRICAGVPVSVEQESHEFRFGCVVPDLSALTDVERSRYQTRLEEVFNCVLAARQPAAAEPGALRVELTERIHLGLLRLQLDQRAASGHPLQVHVWGETVGMSEIAASERDVGRRVAELYTLCFAHPSVVGVFWNGFADGDANSRGGGLLRRDLAPKYAHAALRKLINLDWHARAAGVTDAAGRFRFRGFFGSYRVVAAVGKPESLVNTIAFHRNCQPQPTPSPRSLSCRIRGDVP